MKTMKRSYLHTTLLVACLLPVAALHATTWIGVSGGDWFTPGNWDDGLPGDGKTAIINSGNVNLTNSTPQLAALTLNGDGTLIAKNWLTAINATNVTLTSTSKIRPGAAYSPSEMSNRVWIVCSNLLVASTASIDTRGLGYKPLASAGVQGPGGGGLRGGAGHGGFGGNYTTAGGQPHDSESDPVAPGSAGGSHGSALGGTGGGAVWIDASGTVTVNGTINANATAAAAAHAGGGSGGSINIACAVFGGTDGFLTADGGGSSNSGGAGGGGRIAVKYSPTAQSNAPVHAVTFSVRDGINSNGAYPADIGTLYFPDAQFLTPTIDHSGKLVIPGFTHWAPSSLTVSGRIRFPAVGMHLQVANDIVVDGASAQLELGADSFYANERYMEGYYSDYVLDTAHASPMALTAGGNVVITNGGRIALYASCTNAPTVASYSTLLAATGDVIVASGSTLFLAAHLTNGAVPKVECNNLDLLSGGTISADMRGWGPGNTTVNNDAGLGPGGGGTRAGGAYGGFGGNYGRGGGKPHGVASQAITPGSGGGNIGSVSGGAGGGLIWVHAAGEIRVAGLISANGGRAGNNAAGGAGGGVRLECNVFKGTSGLIRCNGGIAGGTSSGNGGGGHIAILYDPVAQSSAPPVNVRFTALPGAASTGYPADIGTVYFADAQVATQNIEQISGQLVTDSSLSLPSLTIDNYWLRLSADGGPLAVAGDLIVRGSNGQLDIGGDNLLQNGSYSDATYSRWIQYSALPNDATVGGNLVVTNGGRLFVYAASTNVSLNRYGALITVANELTVYAGSWIYPSSSPTSEGPVKFVVRKLTVEAGGGFSADYRGFAGGPGNTAATGDDGGFGEGAGGHRSGGGYGGTGGNTLGGSACGYSNAAWRAGSGGGADGANSDGGIGGGTVWVEARGDMTVDGVISANGNQPKFRAGGGAGGGILLWAQDSFSGAATARLRANGGNYGSSAPGGGGGGGRISVWEGAVKPSDYELLMNGQAALVKSLAVTSESSTFLGLTPVAAGNGSSTANNGQPGTVVFQHINYPPSGTMLLLR